jgi:hypothetical protein
VLWWQWCCLSSQQLHGNIDAEHHMMTVAGIIILVVLVSIIIVVIIIMVIFIAIVRNDGCFHFHCGGSSAAVIFQFNWFLCLESVA